MEWRHTKSTATTDSSRRCFDHRDICWDACGCAMMAVTPRVLVTGVDRAYPSSYREIDIAFGLPLFKVHEVLRWMGQRDSATLQSLRVPANRSEATTDSSRSFSYTANLVSSCGEAINLTPPRNQVGRSAATAKPVRVNGPFHRNVHDLDRRLAVLGRSPMIMRLRPLHSFHQAHSFCRAVHRDFWCSPGDRHRSGPGLWPLGRTPCHSTGSAALPA